MAGSVIIALRLAPLLGCVSLLEEHDSSWIVTQALVSSVGGCKWRELIVAVPFRVSVSSWVVHVKQIALTGMPVVVMLVSSESE